MRLTVDDILQRAPVIPVIVIERVEHAVPLAQALVDGGLPVLEVTLRSAAAMPSIREIARRVDGALVGVGTVTRPEQFANAIDAGASFAVSPGLTESLVDAGRQARIPFLPGVFTPGEVMRAHELGFDALKLFPARQAGGVGMLQALAGPLPAVKFCPTGGIGPDNFIDFLRLPNVACVGGSWVCPAELVSSGDWDGIRQLAAAASTALTAENEQPAADRN